MNGQTPWAQVLDEVQRICYDDTETPRRRRLAQNLWLDMVRGSGTCSSFGPVSQQPLGSSRGGSFMHAQALEEGWN